MPRGLGHSEGHPEEKERVTQLATPPLELQLETYLFWGRSPKESSFRHFDHGV